MHTFADPLNTSMDSHTPDSSAYTQDRVSLYGPACGLLVNIHTSPTHNRLGKIQMVGSHSSQHQHRLWLTPSASGEPQTCLCLHIWFWGHTLFPPQWWDAETPPYFSSWDQDSTGSSSCQHSLRYPQPGPTPEVGTLSLMPVSWHWTLARHAQVTESEITQTMVQKGFNFY